MDFEVITFDCYGTLIDWETGIEAGFRLALENLGLSQSEEALVFDLYQEEEKRIERLPYRPYRRVLAEALKAAANRIGKRVSEGSANLLADQLPKWKPFPDTNPALQRLAAKYKLGILSNVDNDLLSGTMKNLRVRFNFIVTAETVKSYKPQAKHFLEAKKIVGHRTWLHVAASLYHDIEPASRLGIHTVWVNRQGSDQGREYSAKFAKEVTNLTQLADWLG